MSDYNIAGILRAGAYSPNHIGNDASIFHAVADQLRKRGCKVEIFNEEQFHNTDIQQPIIVNMCRETRSFKKLQELEKEGKIVINSGHGIENCTRERMARLLMGNGIPYPESLIVNTNEAVRPMLKKMGIDACWIKKADEHSRHKEDVSFCRHAEEAQELLQEFCYRGIKRAVINKHLDGDLIKFYGIKGDPYFYWFYPLSSSQKSGEEELKDHIAFDPQELWETAQKAAEVMEVDIFGGDCIVTPDGHFTIIDFNDWPSFAPCRAAVAPRIAKAILKKVKALQ